MTLKYLMDVVDLQPPVARDRHDASILSAAIRKGLCSSVKDFLAIHSDSALDWLVPEAQTAIKVPCRDCLESVLDVTPDDFFHEYAQHFRRSAVGLALSLDNVAIARLLVQRGARLAHEGDDVWAVLRAAASRHNAEIIHLLVELGVDVGQRGPKPELSTALHAAAAFNASSVLHALMSQQRVDLTARDVMGNTALHLAAGSDSGATGVLRMLVNEHPRQSLSLDTYNNAHRTPLMMAVSPDRTDAMRLLLNRGADPALGDETGNSLLHIAVRNYRTSHIPLFESILQHLSINWRSLEGFNVSKVTPLMLAVQQKLWPVVDLLGARSAQLDFRYHDGKTVLEAIALQAPKRPWVFS